MDWLYHVAPVVRTTIGNLVLDPSLFGGPVSVDEWRDRQDPSGTISYTAAKVFDRPDPWEKEFDPTMRKTRAALRRFRDKLRRRVRQNGLPPYC